MHNGKVNTPQFHLRYEKKVDEKNNLKSHFGPKGVGSEFNKRTRCRNRALEIQFSAQVCRFANSCADRRMHRMWDLIAGLFTAWRWKMGWNETLTRLIAFKYATIVPVPNNWILHRKCVLIQLPLWAFECLFPKEFFEKKKVNRKISASRVIL